MTTAPIRVSNDQRLRQHIRRWMIANVDRFIDDCNEVNTTLMVETWDCEMSDGGVTSDPDHMAWDVAVWVAEVEDKRRASKHDTLRAPAPDGCQS